LAHQQLYLPGDTAFNEGFATAVEEIGLARWLAERPLAEETLAAHIARQRREADFNALLSTTHSELELLYASDADDDAKRVGKAQAYAALLLRYQTLRDDTWAGYSGYDGWFEQPMNNARLLPVITYRAWSGAFVALY
jgi:predicted aminopeptidase